MGNCLGMELCQFIIIVMKKIKLKLEKETISNLNEVKGGYGGDLKGFSDGCTDGCPLLKTWFNCTEASCTADCGTISCETEAFCTI